MGLPGCRRNGPRPAGCLGLRSAPVNVAPKMTFAGLSTWFRQRYLSIDVRTLGFTRILIAGLLFVDLAKRSLGRDYWYTDSGLLPATPFKLKSYLVGRGSLLDLVGSETEVTLAFAAIGLIYFFFLIGLWTRLFHVLSLIALLSLQIRVALLANGGDYVLCILLLWTAFLPMGAAFSLDARRRADRGRPFESPAVSLAVFAALLQLAVIYFFNALHKHGPNWLDGTAVYWLAQQERIVTHLGYWLRQHLPLLFFQLFSWTALIMEWALPFLILSPWGRPWTRRVAIAFVWSLHLGIAAIANVGLFSPVMMAFSGLLLSSQDWDWLRARLAARLGEDSALVRALSLPTALPAEVTGEAAWAPPARRAGALLRDLTVAGLMLLAISQGGVENWGLPKALRVKDRPAWVVDAIRFLRLNQGWSMFAPEAPRDDMWVVVDAVTEDGRHIDPYNMVASRVADPSLRQIPPRLGQNYHWCDYTVRIDRIGGQRRALADWIFAHHERTGIEADRIASFTVYIVRHDSPAPGEAGPSNVRAEKFLSRARRPISQQLSR
jgi:hypothetical protein